MPATIVEVLTSGETGGGQVVSLRIAERLVELGHHVRFAAPSTGSFTSVATRVSPVDVVAEHTLRDLVRVQRLASYIRGVKATVVHTHTPAAAALLWRIAAMIARVPIVHHVHTPNFLGPPGFKSSVARFIDRATRSLPEGWIAVSASTREGLIEEGYPAARVVTFPNPLGWAREERICRTATSDVIGCVGRLSVAKGQLELIEAFAPVKQERSRAELWLVGTAQGEPEYDARLHARVRELGLEESVRFWGHRSDVRELMKKMTVLVLPSYEEAMPLVVMEAMSVGVPVIATDVGGVSELFEHQLSGLLTSPGNISQITEALRAVLDSVELWERLSSCAYERAWIRAEGSSSLDAIVEYLLDRSKP